MPYRKNFARHVNRNDFHPRLTRVFRMGNVIDQDGGPGTHCGNLAALRKMHRALKHEPALHRGENRQ
jgi:hypothetical protein